MKVAYSGHLQLRPPSRFRRGRVSLPADHGARVFRYGGRARRRRRGFPAAPGSSCFPLIPCRRCTALPDRATMPSAPTTTTWARAVTARLPSTSGRPTTTCFPVPDGREPAGRVPHGALRRGAARDGQAHATGRGAPGRFSAADRSGTWRRSGCAFAAANGCSSSTSMIASSAIAAEMGFIPIDSREGDPVERIRGKTGGGRADRIVEAIGLPLTFLQAVQAGARFGEVVFLGNIRGSIPDRREGLLFHIEARADHPGHLELPRRPWNPQRMDDGPLPPGKPPGHCTPGQPYPAPVRGGGIFRRFLARKEFFNKVVFVP